MPTTRWTNLKSQTKLTNDTSISFAGQESN
jgi:hypothetical protein